MKNMIIAALMTYIFWTDICVIHPLPVLPMIFGVIWMLLASIDDMMADFKRSMMRGNRLNMRINRIKRSRQG
jgi:hypothetical protein